MSFRGDRIEDEPFLWSPEYVFESPEPCLPLRQQHCLCAHTLSTREPLLNNQYHNHYDLNQTMAVTEHSSHICPSNLIPNGPQSYMPYQTYVPITSAFTINGQQLPPSVLVMRRNGANSLRAVNNSARHHVIMQTRVHQSSSSFQVSSLSTQLRRRPSANSSIPPQNEVLGSRRRTYESRSQFGEPSSTTRRRMTIPADESVDSTPINPAEQRREYGPYDPEYERQGSILKP
ncbi:unnamed protein product [Eruca vesicaria subsp. sativa]|uniref:Uncharacterized protein n=1 Tax=Eruca vesicaria subsp. sativa TaxID=29727 RepID=A0ABC8J931_ERUVS|nr:unnamed protein product [Eruca vesicaria subsp. sativa]